MTKKSLTKHRFFLKLILFFLIVSFFVSSVTGITDNYLLMQIQALAYLIMLIPIGIADFGMNKWESFPDYYREYGFIKLSSLINVGISIPSLLFIPLFIQSMFYLLPDTFQPDLLPVVLTNILISVTALYARSFVFHGNNDYNKELYHTVNNWLSRLFYVSFIFLILHAAVIFLQQNFMVNYVFVVNIVAVVLSFLIISYDPLEKFKHSAKELINDNVSENKRFEFLSFIAENIEYFCEFKNFRIRKLKDHYKAEINVVLPAEYTLEVMDKLEKLMNEKAADINNNWIIKLYSKPCNFECMRNGEKQCPVKRIYNDE